MGSRGPHESGRVTVRPVRDRASGRLAAETYRATNETGWLQREIALYDAVLADPDTPAHEVRRLRINLADARRVRFEASGAREDLDQAASLLEQILPDMELTPARVIATVNLGLVLVRRFDVARADEDLVRASTLFVDASNALECPPSQRPRIAAGMADVIARRGVQVPEDAAAMAIVERMLSDEAERMLLEQVDPARIADAPADRVRETTAGLRLFDDNKSIRRWKEDLRRDDATRRMLHLRLALLTAGLGAVAAVSFFAFEGHWIARAVGLVVLALWAAIIGFGARRWFALRRRAAHTAAALDSMRGHLAAWDDDVARTIVESARTGGEPFALFLRGFDSIAGDQPLAFDERMGPLYAQHMMYPYSPVEEKVMRLAEGNIPIITAVNPADLFAVSVFGDGRGIPRLLLPATDWQRHAQHLIDVARLVVLECPEFSPGVIDEITYLVQRGLQAKTLIVIPADDSKALPLWLLSVLQPDGPGRVVHARATRDASWFKTFPHVVEEGELDGAEFRRAMS